MDARSRPQWLKYAETKVYVRKLNPGSSHAALSLTAEAHVG